MTHLFKNDHRVISRNAPTYTIKHTKRQMWVISKGQFGISHQLEHPFSYASVNDTLVQPQAKGGHLSCEVSQHQVQHLLHKIMQTRVRCLLFLHIARKQTKTISGQRQTDWLARAPGVFLAPTHTPQDSDRLEGTYRHTPTYPPKQAAWTEVLIKIKTKKSRPLLSAIGDIKSEGHLLLPPHKHTHTHTV